MRVLALGRRIYLGALHLALMREGHEVRVFAADPPDRRAFGGIIEPVADWRDHLAWLGSDGVLTPLRIALSTGNICQRERPSVRLDIACMSEERLYQGSGRTRHARKTSCRKSAWIG